MKKGIRRHVLIGILGATILSGLPPASAEIVDKISIVVNDEIITESEIQNAIQPVYEKYRSLYSGKKLVEKLEEARQKIAEQIIEDRLILSEAKKSGIKVDDKEVDLKLEEVVTRAGSRQAFETALAEQRMNLKDLKARYKEQIMARRFIDQKIGSRIMITPVDIAKYYNENLADFSQPEEIKLRNILISIKNEPDAKKAAELAGNISERLKEGGDFSGLARVYSTGPGAEEGGLMGWVKRGYLLPEIDKVVFDLKEGETSDIVQTSLGYHIFKLEEKTPARTLSLSESRRDIEEILYRQKITERLKGWIEDLKKSAYIAFK